MYSTHISTKYTFSDSNFVLLELNIKIRMNQLIIESKYEQSTGKKVIII